MKNVLIAAIGILVMAAIISVSGCSDSTNGMMNGNNNVQPAILRVSPANGATGIATTALVGIKFNTPMDTLSVMAGFYFSGGSNMSSWIDSVNYQGGMGHMNRMDRNRMMQMMDSIQIHGTFQWNQNHDSCRFIPNSAMMGATEHMIFMYGQMMSSGGMMMDMGGGMMSSHTGLTFHFTTVP